MSASYLTLPVSKIQLDLLNPRLSSDVSDEHGVIADMFSTDKKRREMLSLMRSIAEIGLDLSIVPVVVIEDGQHVVIEGNRRVTALKLLNRPSLAPDQHTRARIAKIAKDHKDSIPKTVRVMRCPSRADYDKHLEIRHTGENAGAGLKPWQSADIQRFRDQRNSKEAIHTGLLRWCREVFADDSEMLGLVTRIENERKSTTLKRFLMVVIRPELGLTYEGKSVAVEFTGKQLRPFLHQLFTDLLATPGENEQPWSRANQKDVVRYVDEHRNLLPDPNDKRPLAQASPSAAKGTGTPAPPTPPAPATPTPDGGPSGVGLAGASGKGKPSNPSPPRRLFQDVDFTPFGDRIAALGQQTQALSVANATDLCGVMIRVLLDLCVRTYLKANNETGSKVFADTVVMALQHLDPAISKGGNANGAPLIQIYRDFKRQGTDRGYGADRLHDMVHSPTRVVTAQEVLKESQLFTPLLVAMAEKLRDTRG